MRLSRFFITRPIFAVVLAIVITIVGAISYSVSYTHLTLPTNREV